MIRTRVFTVGQNVPWHDEVDEAEDTATHYLLWVDGAPAATARTRMTDGGVAKIERVAVLDDMQGRGIGRILMQHIMDHLSLDPAVKAFKLGAQSHAISFYQKLGFDITSDEYLDAGIPHRDMMKKTA